MNFRGISLFKERVESLPLNDQFVKLALMFFGAEYELGAENFNECDCSGLVCSAVRIMGYDIRVAADYMYTNLSASDDLVGPELAFFLNMEGVAKHVGIVFETEAGKMLIHATYPQGTVVEPLDDVIDRYAQKKNEYYERKYLSWDAVARAGGLTYGLDKDWV